MHRSSFWHSVLIILAAVLLSPAPSLAQDQAGTPVPVDGYEVTDLGTLGGTYSEANGMNEAGQVVGASTTTPDQQPYGPGTRAFLWMDGIMTDLGTLGGETSWGQDVNDAGQIVGVSEIADGTTRAFLWVDGTMTDLGTLGGSHSEAIRINNQGEIVGLSTTESGQELGDPGTHAFLWVDGTMTDLGTLGGDWSRANGINDAGQIVGGAETTDGAVHPVLWENGTATDLGLIPGFAGGRAVRISEDGRVVGFTVDPVGTPVASPAGERHAFLYEDGEMMDLGTLGGPNSFALGVNIDGQVVGLSEIKVDESLGGATPVAAVDAPPPSHGFIWQDGVMTDLNDLISDGEVVVETATTITDDGKIVGGAVVGDEFHAVLLMPVSQGSGTSSAPEWEGPPQRGRAGQPY